MGCAATRRVMASVKRATSTATVERVLPSRVFHAGLARRARALARRAAEPATEPSPRRVRIPTPRPPAARRLAWAEAPRSQQPATEWAPARCPAPPRARPSHAEPPRAEPTAPRWPTAQQETPASRVCASVCAPTAECAPLPLSANLGSVSTVSVVTRLVTVSAKPATTRARSARAALSPALLTECARRVRAQAPVQAPAME